MNDDEDIHEKIRELLRSGGLPARAPDRVWGGLGSGRDRCVVCGSLVSPQEIAIEAEFSSAEGSSSLEFHESCFRAVESQWSRFKPASIPTGNGATVRLAAGADP